MTLFIVVGIGCLECGFESAILGVYPTMVAARAAHSEATPREEFEGDEIDSSLRSWGGDYLEVIFTHPLTEGLAP